MKSNATVYDLASARLMRDTNKALQMIDDACTADPEFGEVFNAVLDFDISVHEYTWDDVPEPEDWFKGNGWYYEKFSKIGWKLMIDPVGPFNSEKEAYEQAHEDYGL